MTTSRPQSASGQYEPSEKHDLESALPPTTDTERGSEKTTVHTDDDDTTNDTDNDGVGPAPDGGLQAWLVTLGGFSLFFCCLGFSQSFGPMADYYLTHQLKGHSADDIAWIGSLSAFLQFFAAMFGGPVFDQYGAKMIRPAAILYVVSIMLLSLCKTYWQVMLCQAVFMGPLQGFLQFPSVAAISQYFDKKRAAALGVAISGSSIGGIVIPIALSKMLNDTDLSFGWTIRIIGFITIPFLLIAIFTVKPRLPPRKRPFWLLSAFKDKKLIVMIASMFFVFLGMFTPLFFLPTYASGRGMDATLAGYLTAILNGASTFGRIIPGVVADKYGRLNIYAGGALATGIIVFVMDEAKSNAALIVYSIVFGFTSGTIISGGSAAFTVCCPDVRDLGTYTGMGYAIAGIGLLVGPPIGGTLVDKYDGFFEAAMFSGAVCVVGSFIAFGNKYLTPQGLWGRV